MADQKISQLTELTSPLSGDTLPIVNDGETKKITVSNLLSGSIYEEVTYSELYSKFSGATLTPGKHYLMTDFQTCYDQPNYDSERNAITTDNYKTGTTEPILLLATSTTGFSPTVCSTLYPQDKISYDITWNTTEVTSGPAKGRITERIDNVNNRADYDFRAVQFIRYVGYFSEHLYNGKITLDNSNGQVIASETGTTFTNSFTVGDIFGVYDPNNGSSLGGFRYYEISSIVSNDEMYVTGRTLTNATNVYYSSGVRLPDYMSPFQCNITGTTNDEFAEYYTFNDDDNYNTYLGNNINYNTFILSNNVFLGGVYNNNTFGGNVVGNTFYDDMDSNIIGPYCQFNILTNDFDRNIIGSYFKYNIIDCDMESNQIDNYFQYNMFGDYEGSDFDYNKIGSNFKNNFLILEDNDFDNNNIGNDFNSNIIESQFEGNEIGNGFYENLIKNSSFDNNRIGGNFYSNDILSDFENNTVGDNFYINIIYHSFDNNTIGFDFHNNTLGTINNESNFKDNHIGNNFKGNLIVGQFDDNKIGNDFGGNEIESYFLNNNIGNTFQSNDTGVDFQDNFILNSFIDNNIADDFRYNQIGNNFTENTIGDGFGFGGYGSRGNVIGNDFNDNSIDEYFYDNNIGDNFENNTIGKYFQFNRIETPLNGIPFTQYLGNLVDFSYSATTGTDGVYTGVTSTTSGAGVNSVFTVTVASTLVTDVEASTIGTLYLTGDTITIASGSFGGTSDLVLTVDSIGDTPMVYGDYNKTIQKRMDGTPILTALDNSGSLYISPSITGPLT